MTNYLAIYPSTLLQLYLLNVGACYGTVWMDGASLSALTKFLSVVMCETFVETVNASIRDKAR